MTPQPPLEIVAAPPVSPPTVPPPPGSVDTHSHVFGPFDRFPPRQSSVYALPAASPAVHAAARASLGVAYGVLTQPAPYGDDPAAMLAAIAASDGALKGVAVASSDIDDAMLAEWAARGIVGLRFVEMRAPGGARYRGSVGFDTLKILAPRMRAYGLHAQLWASAGQYRAALPELRTLGVPLVFDHMASPDITLGTDHADFRAVLDHLADHDIRVKLTLCRFFAAAPDFAAVRPYHDALVEAAPDRLLWGSDWPYVRLDPSPDAGAMLDLFDRWTSDPTLRTTILSHNPTRFYGFGANHGENK